MKRLKIILNSNLTYVAIVVVLLFYIIYNVNFVEKKSKYNIDTTSFYCTIVSYYIEGNQLKLDLSCNEKLIGYYYFNTEQEKLDFPNKYEIGDIVKINGVLDTIKESSNFNLFNYKEYAYRNNLFYNVKIDSINFLSKSKNWIYTVKKIIYKRINNLLSFPYINALVLGNKDHISSDMFKVYKNIGITHLFAVSGMHVGIIILIINKIFKSKTKLSNTLIITILLIYSNLIGTVSILRAMLFFIVSFFNKILKLGISTIKKIIIVISILLFINPYYIFDTGFLYSVIISGSILLLSKRIQLQKSKIKMIFYISFVSFLVSIPITIYTSFELNLLSPIFNAIIVPFVSTLVFPVSLLTIVFPVLDKILFLFIRVLECFSSFLSSISINLIFLKPSILVIVLYYAVIMLSLMKKKFYIILCSLLLIHNNYNVLFKSSYIIVMDVGQGDSILVHNNNYNILIDTGGRFNNVEEKWMQKENYSIAESIIIPVLKSFGISKIDTMILSHGDYDHIGESINIIENFKVGKVYFNCNDINFLEEKIIDSLTDKKIQYKRISKTIQKYGDMLMYSICFDSNNENDSSIINYIELKGKKVLLTGDISQKVEEEFISKYKVRSIDILKIAHHGSSSSSSDAFLKELSPKYSFISVGTNNRYGHPNSDVLSKLGKINTKVYRTDVNGSILINLKKEVTIKPYRA